MSNPGHPGQSLNKKPGQIAIPFGRVLNSVVSNKILIFSLFVGCFYHKGPVLMRCLYLYIQRLFFFYKFVCGARLRVSAENHH